MKKVSINVPVELAKLALKERKVSLVQAYLTLIHHSSGKFRRAYDLKKLLVKNGFKLRTANTLFKELKSRRWIYITQTGWVYVNGLATISEIERFQYARAVKMKASYLKKSKPFFISAHITSALKTQMRRASKTGVNLRTPGRLYLPLPLGYLSKSLNISYRTAIRYKKIAIKAKFIDCKEVNEPILNIKPVDLYWMRNQKLTHIQIILQKNKQKKIVQLGSIYTDTLKCYTRLPDLVNSKLIVGSRNRKPNRFTQALRVTKIAKLNQEDRH